MAFRTVSENLDRARRGTAAACLALVFLIAGCGTSAQDGSLSSTDREAPEFTGPWADALTEVYLTSQTDAQRSILADGLVTEAEYTEVRNQFAACMADLGIEFTFGSYGTMTSESAEGAPEGEAFEEAYIGCSGQTKSGVDWVYESMQRNPENLDEPTIMVACLVRAGLVPDSYTAAQYSLDWVHGTLPYSETDTDATLCEFDPLGLLP